MGLQRHTHQSVLQAEVASLQGGVKIKTPSALCRWRYFFLCHLNMQSYRTGYGAVIIKIRQEKDKEED